MINKQQTLKNKSQNPHKILELTQMSEAVQLLSHEELSLEPTVNTRESILAYCII